MVIRDFQKKFQTHKMKYKNQSFEYQDVDFETEEHSQKKIRVVGKKESSKYEKKYKPWDKEDYYARHDDYNE